jgi:hypothetical protein
MSAILELLYDGVHEHCLHLPGFVGCLQVHAHRRKRLLAELLLSARALQPSLSPSDFISVRLWLRCQTTLSLALTVAIKENLALLPLLRGTLTVILWPSTLLHALLERRVLHLPKIVCGIALS